MNLIINGFHDRIIYPVILELFKKININYCEIIIDKTINSYDTFKNIKTYDFRDLSLANYKINWNTIPPLEDDLIRELYECETIVLKMMDRLQPHIGFINYNMRKRLYYKHLRYWNYVINEKKIDLFLSSNIPHENYDYIIYALCKKKNIPTLMLHQSFPNFVYILEDWKEFMPEIKLKYSELKNNYKKEEIPITLSTRAERIWESQLSKEKYPTPVYMKKRSILMLLKNLGIIILKIIKDFLSGKILGNLIKKESWKIIKFKLTTKNYFKAKNFFLNCYYRRISSKPDLSKKYIYCPLHFQPELTTSPIAGTFTNQILIIEMIASCLPKDVFLYVKENPKQKIWGRTKMFYKDVRSINNAILISKKFNSFELIQNSIAVATATGTAGWEALFRKKPVLMFGHFFYQHAPGVFPISCKNDCSKAINKIINNKIELSLNDIKLFLKSLEELTIHANTSSLYQKYSDISREKNIENLKEAIYKKIKSI